MYLKSFREQIQINKGSFRNLRVLRHKTTHVPFHRKKGVHVVLPQKKNRLCFVNKRVYSSNKERRAPSTSFF